MELSSGLKHKLAELHQEYRATGHPTLIHFLESAAAYAREEFEARVTEVTALQSDPAQNEWQRGWNAAMNQVREELRIPL